MRPERSRGVMKRLKALARQVQDLTHPTAILSGTVIADPLAGVVLSTMGAERLVILGGGPSRIGWRFPRQRDPYATPFEMWGTGLGVTRSFQIHPPEILTAHETEILRTCRVPIYTLKDERRRNANSVVYPFERVRAIAGPGPYCSSFDFMLSLAIAEGFREVSLVGIDLQMGTARERLMEHVSLAYWIGAARSRGITIRIPGAVLRFPYRYGYDYQRERTFGQRMGFWAAMASLNFAFDDGQAVTSPEGWRSRFGFKRVEIGI